MFLHCLLKISLPWKNFQVLQKPNIDYHQSIKCFNSSLVKFPNGIKTKQSWTVTIIFSRRILQFYSVRLNWNLWCILCWLNMLMARILLLTQQTRRLLASEILTIFYYPTIMLWDGKSSFNSELLRSDCLVKVLT